MLLFKTSLSLSRYIYQITKDILPFELLFIVHPNYQRHILSYFYCASAIFLKSWKRAWSMLQKVLKIKMYSPVTLGKVEFWEICWSDDIYIIYDIYILLRLFKIRQNLFIIDKRDIKIQSAEILSNNVFLKCR